MENRHRPGLGWRAWSRHGSSDGFDVTSERLDASARSKSRYFPKTRSWFALESPLELLSPLSVLRVMFALAAATWVILGLVGMAGAQHQFDGVVKSDSVVMPLVGACSAIVWMVLLRLNRIGAGGSRALLAFWTLSVAFLLASSHQGIETETYTFFFIPAVVFTALFLEPRSMVIQLFAVGLVSWVVAAIHEQGLFAVPWTLVAVIVLSLTSLTVVLLTRAARRHDVVDSDTGLPNGFGLAAQLAKLDPKNFLLATVVLEGIGEVREALGYEVGTELVRRAVEDLGQVLPGQAIIGRVDGDDLVVTMPIRLEHPDVRLAVGQPTKTPDVLITPAVPPLSVIETGVELAETLLRSIAVGQYLVGGIEVSLRAHVGLSVAPWDGSDVAELVRRASLSARWAANHGCSIEWWSDDRGALTADDLALLAKLRLAPERGRLSLNYQPQIATGTGRPHSVEALLRWSEPDSDSVAPSRFVPLAERTGLIHRLTEWAINEALDAQVRWRNSGIHLPVSVNISAKDLSDPDLAEWILDRLRERRLPTSCLTVEVTETAVAELRQAENVLFPLRKHGVRISIDDFGTGFTSLAALPSLPLDELKVDQTFVMQTLSSPADAAIVRTTGELAHRLGLVAVAEGVENERISRQLIEWGFDLLQGYHHARPMTEQDLLSYLGPVLPEAPSDELRRRAQPSGGRAVSGFFSD